MSGPSPSVHGRAHALAQLLLGGVSARVSWVPERLEEVLAAGLEDAFCEARERGAADPELAEVEGLAGRLVAVAVEGLRAGVTGTAGGAP